MYIPVFVYGSLKLGNYNSDLLSDAIYVGDFKTSPEYFLLDLGRFPAVVPGGSTAVQGEVYMVDDYILSGLDELEGYPDFYNRIVIDVFPVGHNQYNYSKPMSAIIYFIGPTEIDVEEFELVTSGIW